MLQFSEDQKKALLISVISGALFFLLIMSKSLLPKGISNTLVISIQVFLSAFFVLGVESISKKDWKGMLVMVTPSALYALVAYLSFFKQPGGNAYVIQEIFPSSLLFLLIRNAILKKNRSLLTVIIGAYMIEFITGALWQINFSLVYLQPGQDMAQYPIFQGLNPLLFYLLMVLYDQLSPNKSQSNALFDIETSVDGSAYFRNVLGLTLFMALVLILFGVQFLVQPDWRDLRPFEQLDMLGLIVIMLYLQALIFIQSHKRMMYTQVPETYIYWFMLPFVNVLAALKLSKAPMAEESALAEYHERRSEFCRNCTQRKTDFYKGSICGLTDDCLLYTSPSPRD